METRAESFIAIYHQLIKMLSSRRLYQSLMCSLLYDLCSLNYSKCNYSKCLARRTNPFITLRSRIYGAFISIAYILIIFLELVLSKGCELNIIWHLNDEYYLTSKLIPKIEKWWKSDYVGDCKTVRLECESVPCGNNWASDM